MEVGVFELQVQHAEGGDVPARRQLACENLVVCWADRVSETGA